MDRFNFAEQLKELVGSFKENNESSKSFISDEFLKSIESSLLPIKRKGEIDHDCNSILCLQFQDYSFENVEIGMITFSNTIQKVGNTLLFGYVEFVDPLIINELGEVEVRDRDNFDHNQYYCGKNEEGFLKALIVCANFLTLCGIVDDMWENQELIDVNVKKATELAGGDKYKSFYQMILGDFT